MFKIDKISPLARSPIANQYFVILEFNDKIFISDNQITKLIGVSIKNYIKQLLQFNGYILDGSLYFKNKEDCEAACEYLNTVYGVMNKLLED